MQAVIRKSASGLVLLLASIVLLARRGLRHSGFCCLCLLTGLADLGYAADAPSQATNAQAEPLTLDLSQCYFRPNASLDVFKSFSGRQVIDGLPFQIDGQVRLYGATPSARGKVYPCTKKGIRIGRKYDELHLIHHATWPDAEGQPVAYICLNYADGTEYVFPLRYGVHVRDWFNLPSYEKETVTDPDTTICWRRTPVLFKAPVRIFRSKFVNPSPEKVVDTMDIISSRNLAAYNLLAATVANRRSVGTPKLVGNRHFDGKLVIQVVDDVTGKPIAGALVLPGMGVLNEGVVGSPFYTSSAGKGTIPYPVQDTSRIFASVKKEGYQPKCQSWASPAPSAFTFRLTPVDASAGAMGTFYSPSESNP